MSKRNQLNDIESLLERIDAAIVVRDLGNARSAEAFDGLRKSILVATKSRRTHISHLVSLDESIRNGGSLELVKARLAEYLNELGIERLTDLRHLECFDVVGDSEGEIEVLEPAVVERADDGKLNILRVGKAQRTFSSKVGQVLDDQEPVLELLVEEAVEEAPTPKPNNGLILVRRRIAVLAVVVLALLTTVVVRSCGSSENELDPKETPTSDLPTSTAQTSTLPATTTTTTG
jgi:hypothetical protein